jgi:hypothetical protein
LAKARCQEDFLIYGNLDELRENYEEHRIPEGIEKMTVDDYSDFMIERTKLTARKIQKYFSKLQGLVAGGT